MGATSLCHAPHTRSYSLDFSRSDARERSDLHGPNDARTSQMHRSPGALQDRRGMSAALSPFRQKGDSRLAATGRSGFRQQIDPLACRMRHYGLRIRATTRVFCGPGDQQAPISHHESEGGIRRRVWRPTGGDESTSLMSGYGTVGSSSLHAGSAIGWLAPRPWERRMLQSG